MLNKWSASAVAILLALGFASGTYAGATEKVLYTFPAGSIHPDSGLVHDSAGNLYGELQFGGEGFGVVYRLSPDEKRKGAWAYSVIYTFTGQNDGAFPAGALTIDSAGNLYGSASGGGSPTDNNGVIFELSPDKNGNWSETRTYHFTGAPDGAHPESGVVLDAAGNVLGAAHSGGLGDDGIGGYGTLFKLTPSGDHAWKETTIHRFSAGTDGNNPSTRLALDRQGNLYGTLQYGGKNGLGYIYRFHESKNRWTGADLHDFGDNDRDQTYSGVTLDRRGNVYGTTIFNNGTSWAGSVFELAEPSGSERSKENTWPMTTLYTFAGDADGGVPQGLTFDALGNLYGAAAQGGANGQGEIYKLTPSANGGPTIWTKSVLYDFLGGNDGCAPGWDLTFDKPVSKQLYGATGTCGANGTGLLYSVKN